MSWIKTFVKRFWLSIVCCTVMMMGGGLSFGNLEWNLEAKRKRNIITIEIQSKHPTTVNGMKKAVEKMEKMIKSLKNMDYFCTSIDAHKVYVEIVLKSNAPVSECLKEVGNIVVTAKKPDYIKPPVVQESSKGDRALMVVNVYTKDMDLGPLTTYAKEVISGKLNKIPGVSYVEIKGEPKPEIQVRILQDKIAYYNITVDQIRRAFDVYNQEKGFLARQTNVNEFAVVANSSIKSIDDIRNVIIDFNRKIKMSDISDISFAAKEFLNENWVNGTTRVVTLKVFKTNDGNPLTTSDEVMKVINEWKSRHHLVTYIQDNAQEIRDFFSKTKKTFIEAVIIVIGVVVLFLGSLRSSITPILAIPISLIATFFPMKLFGCSINTSTIMAFLLAIGLVVDDAILVVENITKHRKQGKTLKIAAIDGTTEITTSIIVMTLTLACVFFPAIVSKGAFGATLKEFAITLSISVIISGFVSLTLTPTISARVLSHSDFADKILRVIERPYEILLKGAMKLKFLFAIFAACSIVFSGYIIKHLPRESVPHAELRELEFYTINNGNKHLSFLKKQATIIAEYLKHHKEVENFVIYMNNSISCDVFLKKHSKTPVKQIYEEMMLFLENNVKDVTFVRKSTKSNTAFNIYIYGNVSRDEIKKLGEDFSRHLRCSEKISNAIQYVVTKTGYDIVIDYQKAAAIGCNIETIEKALAILNTRHQISIYESVQDGRKYNIVTSTDKQENLEKLLSNIWVENRDKKQVLISPAVFTKVIQRQQANTLNNFMGLPAFEVEILGAPDVKMGDLVDTIKKLHATTVGHKTELAFTGKAKEFLEDQGEMQKMFVLAAAFIFLILLAQFESVKSALLVMATAPLAIFGALLFIKARGSINIYSTIALITLIGLITKHGILFVHTANQYVKNGMSKVEAAYNAAIYRFRPVLMTTLAMSLGFVPLLFEKDASMITLVQMAQVLFPGLTIGTLMTLFVIPCLFILI